SCATVQDSQLVSVGSLERTAGTVSQPFSVSLYGQSPFDLCLFIDPPTAAGTYQLLAETSYGFPSPTGTIATQLQPSGAIGGTITVTQPYCSLGCFWEPTATAQDGGGACPASPVSSPIWSGRLEFGSGRTTGPTAL